MSLKKFIEGALSLPKGMWIPFKYSLKKTNTLQYPEVHKPFNKRFRGMLINDVPRCIVCELCAKVCPVQCISIKKVRGEDKKFHAHQFDIDIQTCMFCGLCTEACPTESLSMEGGYEGSAYSKEDLIVKFVVKTGEDSFHVYSKQENWIPYERAREIAAIEEAAKKSAQAAAKPATPVIASPQTPAAESAKTDSSSPDNQ